jgi:hypothetical protein
MTLHFLCQNRSRSLHALFVIAFIRQRVERNVTVAFVSHSGCRCFISRPRGRLPWNFRCFSQSLRARLLPSTSFAACYPVMIPPVGAAVCGNVYKLNTMRTGADHIGRAKCLGGGVSWRGPHVGRWQRVGEWHSCSKKPEVHVAWWDVGNVDISNGFIGLKS